MPNHRKRRKVECIVCHRTFDSDYLTRHNRKYHADRLKKHQHIPYKNPMLHTSLCCMIKKSCFIHEKANEKFSKHEKSHCHIDATVDFQNFCFHIPVNEQLSNEAAKTETARKEKVRKNREVMKRLIDITSCLAQQGMAFRGHREVDKPSFFAEKEVLDETCTGNFRSVVNLLAKYDAPLSNHIRAVTNSKLKTKRNPIGKTKGK